MVTGKLPPLMTTDEVAGALRADSETVRRWRRAGKLTAIARPNGRSFLFLRAEVEGLLNGTPLTPEQVAEAIERALGGAK